AAWFAELPRPAAGLTQAMAGGRQRRSPVLAHGWSLAQRDGRQSGFRGQVLRQQHHRIGRAGRVPDAALEEEAQYVPWRHVPPLALPPTAHPEALRGVTVA